MKFTCQADLLRTSRKIFIVLTFRENVPYEDNVVSIYADIMQRYIKYWPRRFIVRYFQKEEDNFPSQCKCSFKFGLDSNWGPGTVSFHLFKPFL